MDKLKPTKNLFKKLIKDEKSVFYAINRVNRTLLGKAKKLLYKKDKVFHKYYLDLEDKNVLYESEDPKKSIPFHTPFVEQRKDKSSTLYSIKVPSNLRMLILLIFYFFPNQQIAYWLLIFSLLKHIPIQWKAGIF